MKVLTILIISIHAVFEGDARMDTRRRNYGSQQMYSFFVKKLGISTHISSVIELKILSLAQSGRISTERLRIMAELDCKLEKMSKVEKFFENQSIRKQYPAADRIGIYLSRPEQPDTIEIFKEMLKDGKHVFIPWVTTERDLELVSKRGLSDLDSSLNRYGFRQPNRTMDQQEAIKTDLTEEPHHPDEDSLIGQNIPEKSSTEFPRLVQLDEKQDTQNPRSLNHGFTRRENTGIIESENTRTETVRGHRKESMNSSKPLRKVHTYQTNYERTETDETKMRDK
ncbi:unnamed protein product [Bemisia tabaci]|uniref:Uncharacterized protein n=1 Tax=Bemisia tabaci TaxID=7038 RepID=A0A9P0A1N4_BEMTA|nr:unnamed protein product [Bemisia tabaci]